jgi:hypothetical protein
MKGVPILCRHLPEMGPLKNNFFHLPFSTDPELGSVHIYTLGPPGCARVAPLSPPPAPAWQRSRRIKAKKAPHPFKSHSRENAANQIFPYVAILAIALFGRSKEVHSFSCPPLLPGRDLAGLRPKKHPTLSSPTVGKTLQIKYFRTLPFWQ